MPLALTIEMFKVSGALSMSNFVCKELLTSRLLSKYVSYVFQMARNQLKVELIENRFVGYINATGS